MRGHAPSCLWRALPFAIATWWSVVTPLIALLALWFGHTVIRNTRDANGDSRRARHMGQPRPAASG